MSQVWQVSDLIVDKPIILRSAIFGAQVELEEHIESYLMGVSEMDTLDIALDSFSCSIVGPVVTYKIKSFEYLKMI